MSNMEVPQFMWCLFHNNFMNVCSLFSPDMFLYGLCSMLKCDCIEIEVYDQSPLYALNERFGGPQSQSG